MKRVLNSVSKVVDAGNRVVFDGDGSYIVNKASGKRTALVNKEGTYVFTMRMPLSGEVQAVTGHEGAQDTGRTEAQDSGVGASPVFHRLDQEF